MRSDFPSSLAGLLEPGYVAKSIVYGIKKKRFLIGLDRPVCFRKSKEG